MFHVEHHRFLLMIFKKIPTKLNRDGVDSSYPRLFTKCASCVAKAPKTMVKMKLSG